MAQDDFRMDIVGLWDSHPILCQFIAALTWLWFFVALCGGWQVMLTTCEKSNPHMPLSGLEANQKHSIWAIWFVICVVSCWALIIFRQPPDACFIDRNPAAVGTVWDAVFEGVFDNNSSSSFGVKQLQLYSRLSAVTSISLQKTPACLNHAQNELATEPSFHDDLVKVMEEADKQVLQGTADGSLFTSTMPGSHSPGCIPYPTQQASFCADLGHSHRVVSSFSDLNFAQQRSTNLELVWEKIKDTDVMSNLVDKSAVCVNSVKDGLCIEAFPMCSEQDLTACMMTCRNMVACVDELVPGIPDNQKADLKHRVHQCQGFCKQATGLSIMHEVTQKFSVPDEGDVLSLPQKQAGVLGPSVALVLSMAVLVTSLRIARQKHAKPDGTTDECSDEELPMIGSQPKL